MKKITSFCCFSLLVNLAIGQVSPQIFTSSGTFVIPSGVTSITVEAIGEGGTGGGNGGGGGGGGGYTSLPYLLIN